MQLAYRIAQSQISRYLAVALFFFHLDKAIFSQWPSFMIQYPRHAGERHHCTRRSCLENRRGFFFGFFGDFHPIRIPPEPEIQIGCVSLGQASLPAFGRSDRQEGRGNHYSSIIAVHQSVSSGGPNFPKRLERCWLPSVRLYRTVLYCWGPERADES